MKISTITLSILLATSLAGCATQKQWEATGGSKADGIVQISYEQGQFENGQASNEQGLAAAIERCKTWGYKGAKITGSEKSECKTMGKFNCLHTVVTQNYQCTK